KVAAPCAPLALFAPAVSYAPTRPYVESVFLVIALFVVVLIGSRIAWMLAVALMGAGVLGTVLNGAWGGGAARFLVLVLLLLPSSRAFVWRRRGNGRAASRSA